MSSMCVETPVCLKKSYHWRLLGYEITDLPSRYALLLRRRPLPRLRLLRQVCTIVFFDDDDVPPSISLLLIHCFHLPFPPSLVVIAAAVAVVVVAVVVPYFTQSLIPSEDPPSLH